MHKMAIPHAQPIEPVSVFPLGERLATAQTTTLVKTDALELIRLVLPAGKKIDQHEVPGEITLQCLEGKVHFRGETSECELTAGQLIYVPGSEAHSLRAEIDSSLLLTILLRH
jgi:quercetin dioxygenase-like cupin family protein